MKMDVIEEVSVRDVEREVEKVAKAPAPEKPKFPPVDGKKMMVGGGAGGGRKKRERAMDGTRGVV